MKLGAGEGAQRANRILAALPKNSREWMQTLEPVTLQPGMVLYEADEAIEHVYFLNNALVSIISMNAEGASVEIGLVGNEGMVGISVFLGASTATMRAVSLIPDDARRMTVRAFRRALIDGAALRQLLSHYTQAVLGQIAQCAACNQRHSIEQRCARWLLMAHDRVGADHFLLTQDSLGHVLDVQRPTVSAAARHLQDAGAIQYSRGKIRITSRACLQSAACACYRMIDEDYARAFGSPPG